jgi:peptide/nickel transport system permease protein
VCVGFLLLLILVAVFANLIAPQDPNAQNLAARLRGPSGSHLLGTDTYGRDILSRMILACRVTLLAVAQGLGIAVVLGIPAGLVAGYLGRITDVIVSRVTDGLMAIPPLIFGIAIIGLLGTGLSRAMIAVGIVLFPRFFRLSRAAAQSVAHEPYIEAVRSDGCSAFRILWRHVLPNSAGPLLVQTTFGIGEVIIAEASLSFLGLGVQPPDASWGSMIREGFNVLTGSAWSIFPPSIAVVATIAASFLLGDGLRDAIGRNMGGRD